MDVDRLNGAAFACAMAVEERVARRQGPTLRLGLGAANGIPNEGRFVSFGIAGALRDDLPVGTVIDATRVVDEAGQVLWEGEPLGVGAARLGTILGANRIIDRPDERARLQRTSGADAVDMESGPLARTGRLVGCIRSISDTPDEGLGGLARGVTLSGDTNLLGLLLGLLRSPLATARAAANSWRALKSLEAIA